MSTSVIALSPVFLQGFVTCAALIIAIGAQNAFVLRQGIRREHVFVVALLCSFSDAFLVSLGVAGLGSFVQRHPLLLSIAKYGGAAFLIVYGFFAAKRAWRPSGEALAVDTVSSARRVDGCDKYVAATGSATTSLKKTVLACLAFTYLNPHCYLDTVVLMGSLSAQFEGDLRWVFAVGAVCASFLWFFSLAYGARLLAPAFAKPRAWRVLDATIALVMWGIAVGLLI